MSQLGTEAVTGGRFQQNAWLLWETATRKAVVVDPGEQVEPLFAAIDRLELAVETIWLTHAHIDHIWGVTPVRQVTGAPVLLHPDDLRWYNHFVQQGVMFGVSGLEPLEPPDGWLTQGQVLHVGSLPFEVRTVPGHAPGHVAFMGEGLTLSGDVLFHDSIGRTDLAGGDQEQLLRSICEELLVLPDQTRVLSGHGPETTIGRERRSNPWLRDLLSHPKD